MTEPTYGDLVAIFIGAFLAGFACEHLGYDWPVKFAVGLVWALMTLSIWRTWSRRR